MFGVPRLEVRARLSGSESNCRIASTACAGVGTSDAAFLQERILLPAASPHHLRILMSDRQAKCPARP